jgi:cellobiose-specific phosphotransferase system component IIB
MSSNMLPLVLLCLCCAVGLSSASVAVSITEDGGGLYTGITVRIEAVGEHDCAGVLDNLEVSLKKCVTLDFVEIREI